MLKRLVGAAPVFNPKYLDFSRHWGFEITPCNVASGWEKGRVENGVGYVKKNFLAGQEFIDFSAVQPAAQLWVDTVADVRVHGATQRRPVDMFEEERAHLKPLRPVGFDLARVRTVSVNKQFRVALDSNTYSVPSRHVGQRLTMKAWADRVCLYAGDQLVASHPRNQRPAVAFDELSSGVSDVLPSKFIVVVTAPDELSIKKPELVAMPAYGGLGQALGQQVKQ